MKFLFSFTLVLALTVLAETVFVGPSQAKTQQAPPPPIVDSKEMECLATNIYFEARGESEKGMKAVALVTVNRVKSELFPNNVCDVVYQAKTRNGKILRNQCQFSWYCDNKADIVTDVQSFLKALDVAHYVLAGNVYDITYGATYYHAYYVQPRWSKEFQKIARIDSHIFYKP